MITLGRSLGWVIAGSRKKFKVVRVKGSTLCDRDGIRSLF